MRIRAIKFQLWLSDEEIARLTRNANRVKMTKSAYIRNLIKGYEPQEVPPLEYYRVLGDLRRIGNNLNQIAQRANLHGGIDRDGYQENHARILNLADELARAFLPKKRKCGLATP